ncbi:MAG: Calx-beta domain-containing protein [Bacteroidia bacterium]
MTRRILTIAVMAFSIAAFTEAQAQVMINSLNTPHTQGFNSLANSGTSSSLPTGWAITESGSSSAADGSYEADNGSSGGENIYSYGMTGNSERALGSLASNTLDPYYGVEFSNNTGAAINSIEISFTIELWKIGSTGRLDTILVAASPFFAGGPLNSGIWVNVDTLVSPHNDSATGVLNGNLPDNQTRVSVTVSLPSPILNGQSGWLRFEDMNITGADDALAIDDFQIIARDASGPPIADCSAPFFSEYIEGSGNNKAIEIYNPTSATLDLSDYKLYRFNNGATSANDSLQLTGMLNSGDVYVIGNPSTSGQPVDPVIIAESDTLHSMTFFNGDDALILVDVSTGDTLDIFGILGQDPGDFWNISGGTTQNYTLVRKSSVERGTTDSLTWKYDWDVRSQDNVTFLGRHTSDCVAPPPGSVISFDSRTTTLTERQDTLDIEVTITNQSNNAITVDVALDGSGTTATPGADFNFTPQTLTFPANTTTSQFAEVIIIDDMSYEEVEEIVLLLQDLSEGSFGDSVHTITINDNEYHHYTIDTADNVDAMGNYIHFGERIRISGVVTSDNFSTNDYLFAIYDRTAGMHIYSEENLNYSVTRGDSIVVWGKVDEFRGLGQIEADSIDHISSGNALPDPMTIKELGENTEGEIVRFRRAWLVNPAQWTSAGAGFNVDVTNGSDTIAMRIDDDVDLYDDPAPMDTFIAIGIGGQFDGNDGDGLLDGYQFLPRDVNDIISFTDPTISFSIDSVAYQEADSSIDIIITLTNENDRATSVEVDLSSSSTANSGTDFDFTPTFVTFPANSSTSQTVTVELIEDAMTEPNETIVLVLRNPDNHASLGDSVMIVTIIDDDPIGMEEKGLLSNISIYPNPANDILTLEASENLDVVRLTNLLGQQVMELVNVQPGATMINIADLEKGVYLLHVSTKDGTATQRFIKK